MLQLIILVWREEKNIWMLITIMGKIHMQTESKEALALD